MAGATYSATAADRDSAQRRKSQETNPEAQQGDSTNTPPPLVHDLFAGCGIEFFFPLHVQVNQKNEMKRGLFKGPCLSLIWEKEIFFYAKLSY
jgi:hypothetical protein